MHAPSWRAVHSATHVGDARIYRESCDVSEPPSGNTDAMSTVSARLKRRVARDFPSPGSANEVIHLLAGVSDSERVQAAIVFAAHGDLQEVKREAELVAVDWRDVLMNGDLAHEDWRGALDFELGQD
jgi:hypothetical protein